MLNYYKEAPQNCQDVFKDRRRPETVF